MEFEILERKFKLINDDLFSYYKHGNSKTEKWHIVKLKIDNGYKRFNFKFKEKTKTISFHRIVYYAHNNDWDIYDSSKQNVIDHIDNDKSNNHISNLRVVTQQENIFNTKNKGYSFNKEKGKYQAQIMLNKKNIRLGLFDSEEEAHNAYLEKKEKLHIIEAR